MTAQTARAAFRRAALLGAAACVLGACVVQPHSDAPPQLFPTHVLGAAAPPQSTKAAKAGSYAIPSADPRNSKTQEEQAWLGVQLRSQPAHLAGVAIDGIEPESPAELAGVLPGDVLLSINGKAVNSPEEVRGYVTELGVSNRCTLAVHRGEEHRLLSARLEAFPGFDTLLRRRHVGKAAPPWGGLDAAGDSPALSLTELRGQVVVLEFWASWCTACRALLPTINRWHDEFSGSGVSVVGITSEPLVDASNAALALDIHYPVMVDPEGTTTLAYSARMLPTVYIIDQRGVIVDMMIGFEYNRVAQVEGLIKQLVANRL